MKESTEFINTSSAVRNIEDFIGSKVVEEITILPPNQSNNKGSRKRILGAAEKSVVVNKRVKRKCKAFHEMAFHDSRNSPSKMKN